MLLTDIAIRQAKPGTAPIKFSDGGGMYLLLNPNGARYWRFNYRIGGKAKTLSLGVYPEVPLKLARERRNKFRRQLFDGIDPSEQRKAEKVAISDTFEAIAREWLALQAKTDTRSNRPALSKSSIRAARRRQIRPEVQSRQIVRIVKRPKPRRRVVFSRRSLHVALYARGYRQSPGQGHHFRYKRRAPELIRGASHSRCRHGQVEGNVLAFAQNH